MAFLWLYLYANACDRGRKLLIHIKIKHAYVPESIVIIAVLAKLFFLSETKYYWIFTFRCTHKANYQIFLMQSCLPAGRN